MKRSWIHPLMVRLFWLFVGFATPVSPVTAAKTNLVEHTFATDAEGWQTVDLPDGAGIGDPAPAIPALWTNAPAAFGPSLVLADASSGTIRMSWALPLGSTSPTSH